MSDPIGSQIRALRTTRLLSQKKLALLSDISQQHLSLIESGKTGLELATLHKLLDALGYELSLAPRPTPLATALLERARQWDKVSAWDATQRPPTRTSLAQAGEFADFFLSRHKTNESQSDLRAHAERVNAARKLLARIKEP